MWNRLDFTVRIFNLKYRAEIDGLRALAVVPVILFHAGFELFSGGFVGVDVFFVISGYLITTILIEDIENKQFSIVNFYERRARRILPALFLVMLVCIPFAWMWMLPSQMKDFSQSLVAVSLFASNILFWRESGYFAAVAEEKPLLHTWSLAVEEQYYVLFPIFLILAWRFGKNRVFWMIVVMAAISLLLSEWGWRNTASANFYLAPTRAWELFAGSIAAFIVQKQGVQKNNLLAIVGLAAIIFSVFFYDETTPIPSVYALVPVVGVVLLVLYADKETLVAKLLSTKGFVGIGLISYSAYLWHQPLFAFARIRSLEHPSVALMLAISFISVFLAYLSWRYVEKPFRDRTHINRNFLIKFSFLGLILFLVFGLAGHRTHGFIDRYPDEMHAVMTTNMHQFERNVRDCWAKIETEPKIESGCLLGDNASQIKFAIIGDSHAAMLLNEIDRFATDAGIAGVSLTARSCPPIKDVIRVPAPRKECAAIRSEIFNEKGVSKLPDNLIVMARWPLLIERKRYRNSSGYLEGGGDYLWKFIDPQFDDYSRNMQHEIKESLNLFLENGKRLIIVYPNPEMGWVVPEYLTRKFTEYGEVTDIDGSTSYASFMERVKSSYDVLDSIGNSNNVVRIYPSEFSCDITKGICISHREGQPIYFDDDHLTDAGAKPIAKSIIMSIVNESDLSQKSYEKENSIIDQ